MHPGTLKREHTLKWYVCEQKMFYRQMAIDVFGSMANLRRAQRKITGDMDNAESLPFEEEMACAEIFY